MMQKRAARILLVDDELRNLKLLETIIKAEGHETETAMSGEQALAAVARQPPDLILLDVMMPGMTGHEVAGKLKLDPHTKAIPIIMVTSLDDRQSKLTALNMGAEDFLTKPVDRAELWVRVRNLLRLKEYGDFLADHARILEEQVRKRTDQLTTSYRETIAALTSAASYRDEETGAHVVRISHYCKELATFLGLDAEFCDNIFYASPMHDIGKIAIPDKILLKPGGFTPEEWEVMKTHAALGAKMLQGGDSPYIKMGRDIALSHHERWDGTGYPQRLKGEQIPLAARLMCIADAYDAMRSKRPYKPPFDHDKAVNIILKGDGRTAPGHFDPQVLAAFESHLERFRDIYEGLADQDPAPSVVLQPQGREDISTWSVNSTFPAL
jgi:putative two-component system response regulator